MIKLDKNSKISIPIQPYIVENISGKEVEIVQKPKEKRSRENSVVIDRQVLPNGIEMIKVPGEKSVRIDMTKAKVPPNEKTVAEDQQKKSKEFGILHNGIEKNSKKNNVDLKQIMKNNMENKKSSVISIYPVKKNQVPNNDTSKMTNNTTKSDNLSVQMPKTFSKISKNVSKNEEPSTAEPLSFSQKINDIQDMLKNSNKFGNVVESQLPKIISNKFGNMKSHLPSTVSITKSKINFSRFNKETEFSKMKPNQNKNTNSATENRECYFCTMCYENSTYKSTNPGNVRKHIGKKFDMP